MVEGEEVSQIHEVRSFKKDALGEFQCVLQGGEEGQVLKDVRHAGDGGSESREYDHGDNKDGCSYDGLLQGLCEG